MEDAGRLLQDSVMKPRLMLNIGVALSNITRRSMKENAWIQFGSLTEQAEWCSRVWAGFVLLLLEARSRQLRAPCGLCRTSKETESRRTRRGQRDLLVVGPI